MLEVSFCDIKEIFFFIVNIVVFAVLSDVLLDPRQSVQGHSWEDMMFNLELHSSAKVVDDQGFYANTSCCDQLVVHVVINLIL